MARAWLTNSRGIAKRVKNASSCSNFQLSDLGANRECPNCQYVIDNSDASFEMPGLPAGVKFDPSDVELLEHLAGKVGIGVAKSHMFIDEFISTLDREDGICYTHPENLPGVRKDGICTHFFHRSLNAYATGNRKRRKVGIGCSQTEECVRWHKTGKTKPVLENGSLKGWKKIMVLYKGIGKGCKPDRANWVMHQYHIGMEEVENEGELVVSKIFYQQMKKQMDGFGTNAVQKKSKFLTIRIEPLTPKTMTHEISDVVEEHAPLRLKLQKEETKEIGLPAPALAVANLKNEDLGSVLQADESQAVEEQISELINEEHFSHLGESSQPPAMICNSNDQIDIDADSSTFDFLSLDDLDVGLPPLDLLSDFQFSSEESIMNWLDWL